MQLAPEAVERWIEELTAIPPLPLTIAEERQWLEDRDEAKVAELSSASDRLKRILP
jgi:hypothetical protein